MKNRIKRAWGIRHIRYLRRKGEYEKAFRVLGRFRGKRGLQLTRKESRYLDSLYQGGKE